MSKKSTLLYMKDDKVEANFHETGNYYPATILQVHEIEKTYDVAFYGQVEKGVKEDNIKLLERHDILTKSNWEEELGISAVEEIESPKARFHLGDLIEANYRGKGKYYSGKIRKDRGDGSYDIDYDDGEIETRVSGKNIRPRSLTQKFQQDEAVEVNFKGLGTFYPATIKGFRSDGTYDVAYFGQVEHAVKESNIHTLGRVQQERTPHPNANTEENKAQLTTQEAAEFPMKTEIETIIAEEEVPMVEGTGELTQAKLSEQEVETETPLHSTEKIEDPLIDEKSEVSVPPMQAEQETILAEEESRQAQEIPLDSDKAPAEVSELTTSSQQEKEESSLPINEGGSEVVISPESEKSAVLSEETVFTMKEENEIIANEEEHLPVPEISTEELNSTKEIAATENVNHESDGQQQQERDETVNSIDPPSCNLISSEGKGEEEILSPMKEEIKTIIAEEEEKEISENVASQQENESNTNENTSERKDNPMKQTEITMNSKEELYSQFQSKKLKIDQSISHLQSIKQGLLESQQKQSTVIQSSNQFLLDLKVFREKYKKTSQ